MRVKLILIFLLPYYLYCQEGKEFAENRDYVWDSISLSNAKSFVIGLDDTLQLKCDLKHFDVKEFKIEVFRISLYKGGEYYYSVSSIGSFRDELVEEVYCDLKGGDMVVVETVMVSYKSQTPHPIKPIKIYFKDKDLERLHSE